MYYHNDAYVQANLDSGFRTVICSALNDFDKDPENIEREYLKFNASGPLIGYRLGIHAEYTTGPERLSYAAGLVQKYKTPFFTHNSETRAEVEGCIQRHGMKRLIFQYFAKKDINPGCANFVKEAGIISLIWG